MRILVLVAAWSLAPFALADIQACNEMYPADAYPPEERARYIHDCLAAYGDGDSGMETYSEPEPDYSDYQGTVDDYVQSLPEPEPEPDMSEPGDEY